MNPWEKDPDWWNPPGCRAHLPEPLTLDQTLRFLKEATDRLPPSRYEIPLEALPVELGIFVLRKRRRQMLRERVLRRLAVVVKSLASLFDLRHEHS